MPKTIRDEVKHPDGKVEPALVTFAGDTFAATITIGDPDVTGAKFSGTPAEIADLIEDNFEAALGYRVTAKVTEGK